jgi:DDE superfamily endonuclease
VEGAATGGGASLAAGAGGLERGGLTQALTAVGVGRAAADAVAWSDEMRLGLHGQVRRRWAPRGITLRQRGEVKYEWRYLALAVSAAGALHWRWLETMKKEGIAETVSAWKQGGIGALVWDSAPSHRAKLVRQAGPPLVALPPYSPELDPAERIFEELRR